jgi:hypothetical protein
MSASNSALLQVDTHIAGEHAWRRALTALAVPARIANRSPLDKLSWICLAEAEKESERESVKCRKGFHKSMLELVAVLPLCWIHC